MTSPRAFFILKVAILATGFLAALVGAADRAFASNVTCGQVIVANTTLDSDLLACPGDGLVIGADNVSLNLNGHTIEGTGQTEFGVNDDGHSGLIVRNGTIRNFNAGVNLLEADGNVVRDLNLPANIVGVAVYDSNLNVVQGNDSNSFFGIQLTESDGNQVLNNTHAGSQTGVGTYLLPDSDRNLVAGNSATNDQYGVLVFGGDGNRLERNVVYGNNRGVALIGATGSDDAVLERNTAWENANDGIFVAAGSLRALLERNVAYQNGDDGIDVEDSSATLARNRSFGNADLGIDAVAGVTDGGGNRAFGNGNPSQCLYVTCR